MLVLTSNLLFAPKTLFIVTNRHLIEYLIECVSRMIQIFIQNGLFSINRCMADTIDCTCSEEMF